MVDQFITGDYVELTEVYPGRVGQIGHGGASFMRGRGPGRWVVFRDSPGHWQSGFYESNTLVFVGLPNPAQPRLKL